MIRILLLNSKHNISSQNDSRVSDVELDCMNFAELAQSRSFYDRSLFVDACTMSFELYSRAFFKDYFLEPLLGLHEDRIPNIRLRLCRLLPRIRRSLHSTDNALRALLESSMHSLYANEKDRDVIGEWEKVRYYRYYLYT